MVVYLYLFYFGLMVHVQSLTVPTGCVYEEGIFTCDFTSALPLNASSFDPQLQRLKVTNINGSFTAVDVIDFDSVTSLTFDANYAPSLELECSPGGALILNDGSFTGFSWVQEVQISNCAVSTTGANSFRNFNTLNHLLIFGGNTFSLSPDTLQGLNIQKDYSVPLPRGEVALINVKTDEYLLQTLFTNLLNVTIITIVNCGITALDANTFQGLSKLSKVTIDESQMTYLAAGTFSATNEALGILVLRSINWNCTCSRLWWVQFANDNKISLEGDLICSTGTRVQAYYDNICTSPVPCPSDSIKVGSSCVTELQIAVYTMALVSFLMLLFGFGIIISNRRIIMNLKVNCDAHNTFLNNTNSINSQHTT